VKLADHPFDPPHPLSNKNSESCASCGKIPSWHPPSEWVQRDPAHERHLTEIAAEAAGYQRHEVKIAGVVFESTPHEVPDGLSRFAHHRAHPGPVRVGDRDFLLEIAEELADARNYCCWLVQKLLPDVMAGDVAAAEDYGRAMSTLQHLTRAWEALHT